MSCFDNAPARLALIALLFTFSGVAAANIIHVPADQPTIQQAIDASTNGDTVLVSPGTYTENIDFHGKAITVKSQSGPNKTIIDGGNIGTVVNFGTGEGPSSVITGFTIQHGSASFGAGIMMLVASPTITRNIFKNNAEGGGGFGAAIGGNNASPVVQRNTFLNNTCDTQFLSGVVSFVNTSSPSIINNIFQNNPCRAINMTLPTGTAPVVANNTIVHNTVGIRVDARVQTSAQLYLNNIIVANQMGLEVDFLSTGNEPTWTNNLVFKNTTNYFGISDLTGTNGNISADPVFVNLATRNLQLQSISPAIDAGTLSVPNLPPTDFAGNPRVEDGNNDGIALPDMGAYEFVPPNR